MMKTTQSTLLKYARFGAALCAAILEVLQFLPYWEVDGKSISVAQYQWFPRDNKPLTKYLQGIFGAEYDLNRLGGWSIAVLVFSVVAIYFVLRYRKNPTVVHACLCIFVGVSGMLMIANPVFRTGSLWLPILVLSILMTVFSVCFLVDRLLDMRNLEKKFWEK